MRKVPKLRFKEFSDEWEEKEINKILIKEKSAMKIGPFGSQLKKETFVDKSSFKVYGQENIFVKDFLIGDRYITKEHFEKLSSNEIKEGDFLISSMGTIGNTIIAPSNIEKGIMDSHIIRLRLEKNRINPLFLQNLFLLKTTQNKIKSLSVGGIMEGLSIGIIKELSFIIPYLQEQEKIANFLSSIDKKISLTEEKLELFRAYKRGVMQKIFSQELRFKDSEGNDYPEWEERKLGEISEVKDGTHDSPKYVSNGFPLVTSKNVKNGKIDLNEVNYISKEDFDIINKRSKVSKGDILMGMIGTIGNLAIVDREDFAIKNVALIKEKSDLKNNFLIYLLQSYVFHKKIALLNEGGTQKFISLGNIRNLLFFIPTLEEQQKIADFLSSIDSKIESIEKELEGLKKFKKGLLQQMFV